MRSRVIPGSLVTIDLRVPVSRLNKVDLPTFGRPTITSDAIFFFIWPLTLQHFATMHPRQGVRPKNAEGDVTPVFFGTAHSKGVTGAVSGCAESKGLICTKIVQNREVLGSAESKGLSGVAGRGGLPERW